MSLTSAQMARLSSLLDEALALPVDGRDAWLASLAPADAPLFDVLRQSLLSDDPAGATPAPVDELPWLGVPAPGEEAATGTHRGGERVGAYELQRVLGTGGMGDVWLARRADGAFERQVALKIPRLDLVPAEMAARFARECRILATLEYPGIARLYDAGVDAHGVPFIAMEYVQGDSLIEWCHARHLDLAARIDIFLQVLDAVGHAHQRQILHRDLKPSNILVTGQGQVRLLDFGVARLLEEEPAGRPTVTRIYGRALTPEYAAPELLRGDPIDVRSDIYSLGVVLHELLTGHRPARETTAALGGDVRAVVQRMLASQPADRYPDVGAVTADLRRVQLRQAAAPRTASGRNWLIGAGLAVAAAVMAGLIIRGQHHPAAVQSVTLQAPVMTPESAAPSVAVLPFVDLSEQHDQGYLGDGLAEELINTLARIPGLKVPARTSSFAYRDRHEDARQIARELGVAAIIEGSVRSADQRLRISAQLIDAKDGSLIWSEHYDRRLTDLFALQDELVTRIEHALQLKLASGAPLQMTQAPPSRDVEAYRLTLQGFSLLDRPTRANVAAATQSFQSALKRDPDFSRAYAGLATASLRTYGLSWNESHDLAEAAARKALALDPASAKAESILGQIAFERYDLVTADQHHRRAAMLDPSDAVIKFQYAKLLAYVGHMREAVQQMRDAYSLAPANPAVVGFAAHVLAWVGNAESDAESEKYARLAIELGLPEGFVVGARVFPALRHAQSDHYAALMRVGNGSGPDLDRSLALSRLVFAARSDPGQRDAALAARVQVYPADVKFTTQQQADLCAMSAMSYAYLGANDPAYELANQCLDNKASPIMLGGEICPWPEQLRGFRRDRRFQAYIARRGAIPYYERYGAPDDCDFQAGKLSCR